MTAAIALLPDWYCAQYVRDQFSFTATFLAVVQWVARIVLLPLNITWSVLLRADTMLYEIMAIGIEIGFLAWIWWGDAHPHAVLLARFPRWAWTLIVIPLHVDHLYQFARRNRNGRAIALIFDLSLYLWLLLNILLGKFYFTEVLLWTFFAMGVIAVFSLHSDPGAAHGTE